MHGCRRTIFVLLSNHTLVRTIWHNKEICLQGTFQPIKSLGNGSTLLLLFSLATSYQAWLLSVNISQSRKELLVNKVLVRAHPHTVSSCKWCRLRNHASHETMTKTARSKLSQKNRETIRYKYPTRCLRRR